MIDFLLNNGADLNPVLEHFCNQHHKPKLKVLIERCRVLGIGIPENHQNNTIILDLKKELMEDVLTQRHSTSMLYHRL